MRAAPVALTVALALSFGGAVLAQPMVVPIDHSQRLTVQGAAASVVVGNPQVADVTVVDSHTLFVSGRGYGETDVVVLDHAGRTIYSGEVTVTAPSMGRVSVWRGQARTDMACAPNCQVTIRSPTSPSAGGASAAGSSSGPGGGGMGSMMAGLLGGAMSAAGGAANAAGSAIQGSTASPVGPS